jgi:predicted GNAT family N-acyltransferase
MQVIRPQAPEEFDGYYHLRWQVLRAPWGGLPGSERDDLEDSAVHAMICSDEGQPLAVGRLHFNSADEAQIRYMAVAEHAHRQGLGRRIVEHLESVARSKNAKRIILNARDEVVVFYAALGYEVVGPGPTLFQTVPHSKMQKSLQS